MVPGQDTTNDQPPQSIFRLASAILVVAGIGLLLLGVLHDTLAGNAHGGIGLRESLGILGGTALLLGGAVLSPRAQTLRRQFLTRPLLRLSPSRWAAALLFLTVGTVPPLFFSASGRLSGSTWIVLCYVIAACLVLPLRLGAAVFLLTVLLQTALASASAAKIDLTGLPLTILDLRLAVSNPAGVWSALDLPTWTRYATIAGFTLAVASLGFCAAKDLLGSREIRAPRQLGLLAAGRASILITIALLAAWHLSRVFSEIGQRNDTWDIAGVTQVSNQVGVLTFLAYSYRAERENAADFFRAHEVAVPVPSDEVMTAARRYVTYPRAERREGGLYPNILLVLAESTFDPSRAFELQGSFRSDLFSEDEQSAAVGPLFVNAIGGGSWITEFEVVVGIDARVFGYSGYYTHASVSPFVSHSLATYLGDKGYETWVFIPHDGAFYNYRAAYRHYGFERVLDSKDLRQTVEWYDSDVEVIEDFIGAMGELPTAPFFAHVLLNENHGPHDCEASAVDSFPVRLANSDDFEANCELSEYLERLESTTAAVSAARDYLRDLERRTGRPFVLLVYGDHQPYSFTGEWGGKVDFDPLRNERAKNITFFHLYTSMADRIACCEDMIPATLLPTLVSAFTSEDVEELYLPVNLWLYEQCGYDAVGWKPLTWLTDERPALAAFASPTRATAARSDRCESAYRRALAMYRGAGVIMAERER
jgi:hypothetical protein